MAHNEVHLLQVGHGPVGEGALRLKCLLSNIQLARHLEIKEGGHQDSCHSPMAREGPGLEGAGEAEPGTLWVQSWEPGPGRTWPVIWEERFSFMEEMSLVLLSLRLGLCRERDCE